MRSLARFVAVAAALLASAGTTKAAVGYFDSPGPEVAVAAALPRVGSQDASASVLTREGGHVVVLMQEDHSVKALVSNDGGATFGPELYVAGGPGQLEAIWHAGVMVADGTVYVALVTLDPEGDRGVRVVRSDDGGNTFVVAGDVQRSSSRHGVAAGTGLLAIDADLGGRVVVGYGDPSYYGRAMVAFSSDRGGRWYVEDPVLDSGDEIRWVDIVLSGSTAHFAWCQYDNGWSEAYYTRLTDNADWWELPQDLGPGRQVDLTVTSDGTILVARSYSKKILLSRSTNDGRYFSSLDLGTFPEYVQYPRLHPAPIGGTVLLVVPGASTSGTQQRPGSLFVTRSADHGATFGAKKTLASTTQRSPDFGVARTRTGRWAVAWADHRNDTTTRTMTDARVATSSDDGVTFDGGIIASSHLPGVAGSRVGPTGLAPTGTDDLLVAMTDDRLAPGVSQDVYLARSASGGPFSDRRIDSDATLVNVTAGEGSVAIDGARRVFVAFSAVSPGPFADVFVSPSSDGGRTFGVPVRLPSVLGAGSRLRKLPELRTTTDGKLHVVYQCHDPTSGQRLLYYNVSSDAGATWRPDGALVGSLGYPCGGLTVGCESTDRERIGVHIAPGAPIAVAYNNESGDFVSTSIDAGASFSTVQINRPGDLPYQPPALCGTSEELVACFTALDADYWMYAWLNVSHDGGRTWDGPILGNGASDGEDDGSCTCASSEDGRITTAWSTVHGDWFLRSRESGAWSDPIQPTMPSGSVFWCYPAPFLAWSRGRLLAACSWWPQIHLRGSDDGGRTFAFADTADYVVDRWWTASVDPRLAADGTGNVFAIWREYDPGTGGVVAVRHSADDGIHWNPALRLDKGTPQAARTVRGYLIGSPIAAAGSVTHVAFLADRESLNDDVFVASYDARDLDGDGTTAAVDCDDFSPASVEPVEVSGMTLSPAVRYDPNPVRVWMRWHPVAQSSGAGSVYDLVSGELAALGASASFGQANCLAGDLRTWMYGDTHGAPAPGTGDYYLVRASNGCGTGSYGDGMAVPDARDVLDAAGPCP